MTGNESPPSDRSQSAPAYEPICQLILSAAEDGNLLQHLSTVRFDAIAPTSEALAELHNTGDLNFLSSLRHGKLSTGAPHVLHKFLELFRRTLLLIDCDVSDALATVNSINRQFADAGAVATAHDALYGWLERQGSRPKQALPLVLRDNPLDDAVLRAVLTAGGRADPEEFTTQAVTLSSDTSPARREAALFALGRIVPLDSDVLVDRAFYDASSMPSHPQLQKAKLQSPSSRPWPSSNERRVSLHPTSNRSSSQLPLNALRQFATLWRSASCGITRFSPPI